LPIEAFPRRRSEREPRHEIEEPHRIGGRYRRRHLSEVAVGRVSDRVVVGVASVEAAWNPVLLRLPNPGCEMLTQFEEHVAVFGEMS
jgi:hypothetical protein